MLLIKQMDFSTKLENYAKLTVQFGLNIQKGQILSINTESYNKDLAILICDEAYKAGAKYVELNIRDPRSTKSRIQHSAESDLSYCMDYINSRTSEIVKAEGANLSIISPEDPDVLQGLNPDKINKIRLANYLANKVFYDEGINLSKVHWTLIAASTPGWACKIFPQLEPQAAHLRLWDEIFKICRVDRPDFISFWQNHNRALHQRSQKLNSFKIKSLHFKGPDTDLRVGLSPQSLFKGGTELSSRGAEFEPNIPTEECFSTPDWRLTEGHVRTTRPFRVNGALVQDLRLVFRQGEIVEATASSGLDSFNAYRQSDPGGSRLGEVALVGTDSPIFQSGIVFDEILYDENAACHIAIGSAYTYCLQNGKNLSKSELADLGCNDSTVHTDMMISDENVSVIAELFSGENILLIENGNWTSDFKA